MILPRVGLVAFLMFSVATPQEKRIESYTQRVAAGLRTTVSSPELRWHWAATGVGILLCLPADDWLQERAVKEGLMPEVLADIGNGWGGAWAALTILPGIYLAETSRGTSGEITSRRLEFAFTSLALVGATTQILKYVVGRERPDGSSRMSFPSGHTSIAFGVAEVVRTLYGNGVGAAFYSLAMITGISRIHDNRHYLSDVVAGAGLGVGLVRGFSMAQSSYISITDRCLLAVLPGQVTASFRF